ncbi:ATP-grasp domain-containing protein [Paenibacillus puldeungensis]|uniref:ATP-grasp domain-containing protein n=1 Tax=Paenibacillus puldeungensis TaxID=696536 RepID=A0ABW3RUB2_9BACL
MDGAKLQNLHNRLILSKAHEMGITCRPLLQGCEDFLELTYQGRSIVINKTRSHKLSLMAGLLAKNKEATNLLLQRRGLPIPPFMVISEMGEEAVRFLENQSSVVVKPLDASGSAGVTLDVRTRKQLGEAIRKASFYSKSMMLQQFIPGKDYRVLIINGKVAAVTEYRPACVIGDGSASIRQLIQLLNESRIIRNDIGQMEAFAEISMDSRELTMVLDKQGVALDDLIPAGTQVELYDTQNAAANDIREIYADRTDTICEANKKMAIDAAEVLQIDVAGIDIRCPDISLPLMQPIGAILEVNALPDMTYHVFSYQGASRDVVRLYLEYLFEEAIR